MYDTESIGAYNPNQNAMAYGGGGDMLKGLTSFGVFIAILAILLGVVAAGPEFLNPISAQAQAYRLNTETRAMADKNDYQRESYQIELDKQRALAQMEIEQQVQRAQALTEGLAWAALVVPAGIFALLFAGAIYVICLAAKLPRHPIQQVPEAALGKIKPFPVDRVKSRAVPAKLSG